MRPPPRPAALIAGRGGGGWVGQTSLVSDLPARSLIRKCLPTAGSGKHSLTITCVKQPEPFFLFFFWRGGETIPTFCFVNEGEQREQAQSIIKNYTPGLS